jgi:hypothetical protein
MIVVHYRDRGVPIWLLIALILVIPASAVLLYDQLVIRAHRGPASAAELAVAQINPGVAHTAPPGDRIDRSDLPAPTPATGSVGEKPPGGQPNTLAQTEPSRPVVALAADPLRRSTSSLPPETKTATGLGDGTELAAAPGRAENSATQAAPDQSRDLNPKAGGGSTAAAMPSPASMPDRPKDPDPTARPSEIVMSSPEKKDSGRDRLAKSVVSPPVDGDVPTDTTRQPDVSPTATPTAPAGDVATHDTRASADVGNTVPPVAAEAPRPADSERARFYQELRDALELPTNEAGQLIDQASRSRSRAADPAGITQARRVWMLVRAGADRKIGLMRSKGVSESIILDLLSADLHSRIGTRGGPRNVNEVRVRAAKTLLSHAVPPPTGAGAGSDRPGAAPSTALSEKPPPVSKTWPFNAPHDPLRSSSRLDLRYLNEKIAGETGFIRLSADGDSFVLGNGKPVRFWGVSINIKNTHDLKVADHRARFLAKRGVNMVRLYAPVYSHEKRARSTDLDNRQLNTLWANVAAFKRQGIYATIVPYWSMDAQSASSHWGLGDWPEKMAPFGLLFFNPVLQEAYKSWMSAMLSRPNPHTGIPLAKDPAVAIIQLQNEDSLLFYTAQNIKGQNAEILGKRFAAWLRAKYGSLDAAFLAWNKDSVPEDRLNQGIVGLLLVWEWTQPRTGGRKRRLDDQLQFYAETMHAFNAEIKRYLRDELGAQQLVNAGNWHSVDVSLVDDAERWSSMSTDILATNRYFAPAHIGPDRGWRLNRGDTFEDVSVLFRPREFPLNLRQAAGRPMMITESHWVTPLGYQSEGPFLVAAYQSLTGVDVIDWADMDELEWSNQDLADWNAASRKKWSVATPMILGQFPAAALLFRGHYLEEGAPVVEEHRSLAQIWERKPPVISEDPSYDPNRDQGDKARPGAGKSIVDPLAFLVGPVKVHYDSDPRKTTIADLSSFIDNAGRVVRSNTGQITFDHGRGLCTIDAPRAQGACGFLGRAGSIELSTVTIESGNDYASILVIALDAAALTESRRILVQVGTRARPTDWADQDVEFKPEGAKVPIAGKRIISTGRMPWAVESTRISLSIKNSNLRKAVPLDVNGDAGTPVAVEPAGPVFKLALPARNLYTILEAN